MVNKAFLAIFDIYIGIYPFCRAQIATLIVDEAVTIVLSKYADCTDIFSLNFAAKLPNYIRINGYLIDLVKGQQLPYWPIYSLKLVKLKVLKTYIKTNLANSFIRPSKFFVDNPIFFIQKPNSSF